MTAQGSGIMMSRSWQARLEVFHVIMLPRASPAICSSNRTVDDILHTHVCPLLPVPLSEKRWLQLAGFYKYVIQDESRIGKVYHSIKSASPAP